MRILPCSGKARTAFVAFVGETVKSSTTSCCLSLTCTLGRLFRTVTFLIRLSSHSCSTSLGELPNSPSKVVKSLLALGVTLCSSAKLGPRPSPEPEWLCGVCFSWPLPLV